MGIIMTLGLFGRSVCFLIGTAPALDFGLRAKPVEPIHSVGSNSFFELNGRHLDSSVPIGCMYTVNSATRLRSRSW
jgi:hypothetical protein